MWQAQYEPQCDITELADSPVHVRAPIWKMWICVSLIHWSLMVYWADQSYSLEPGRLWIHLNFSRCRPLHWWCHAVVGSLLVQIKSPGPERKVFIILEPTIDGLPTNDDGAPRLMVSTAAQEFLKRPSKVWRHDVHPRLLYWCSVEPKISIICSSHASIRVREKSPWPGRHFERRIGLHISG
jgi:hypothetical protein